MKGTVSEGVQEEFHPYLMQAHSAAHAIYLKDRILQKQADQQMLGDLGWKGNVGRFAAGAIMPDQLLMAAAGGWVAKGIKGAELLGQAGRSTAKAAAGGIAFGAVENGAYEKLRQSVNFEDDSTGIAAAALLGAAFTAPFAIAGARSERRIAAAAGKDTEALNALQATHAGEDITPQAQKAMDDALKAREVVMKAEKGEIEPEAAAAELDKLNGALTRSDEDFLAGLQANLRERGETVLDEVFPSRAEERARAKTKEQLGLNEPQVPLLGYKPDVVDGPINALPVDPRGNVLPSLNPRDIDAELQRLSKKRHPKDPEKATSWVMEQRAKLIGLDSEHVAKVETAKATKRAGRGKKEPVAELKALVDGEAPAKAPDSPSTPLAPTSEPIPPATLPEASKAPRDRTGEYVSWADHDGNTFEGTVEGRNSQGKLTVKTREGSFKVVADDMLDLELGTGTPPEGFLANSIGAAQATPIDTPRSHQTTAFSKGRLDFYAKLNRSPSMQVRELADDLIKDAIQTDDLRAQAMTASEWKSQLRRTIGGGFHKVAREAAAEARKVMQVPFFSRISFNNEFHGLVSRLTRGDLSVVAANEKIAPMLQKASAAQKRAYAQFLEEARKAGVKGAEDLDPNTQYVNRVWDHRGIRNAIMTHGAEAVEQVLANAIKVAGHTGNVAKARSFLNTVRKLEFAPVMQNISLYAQDMGTLRRSLAEAGLDEGDIDNLVDLMFSVKETAGSDAGRTATLKYRFDIDETMGAELPGGTLRISDLLENDARVLMDLYGNSMAGHIGMAKKGIQSQADFAERLRLVSEEGLKNPEWDTKRLGADVRLLQDIYNNITGKPMSTADFGAANRMAGMMRGYTRSVMLGQLGVASAFEMKQAVALMGFKTFLKQMPAFSSIFTAIRNGYIPDSTLARDMEHMAGFGTEMAQSYIRSAEIDEGVFGRSLSAAEYGANVTSHAVDILSGNASFTSLTKQLTGMMASQRMVDFATGARELTPELRRRMVGWGVDDDRIDGMLAALKHHSTSSKTGKLETIDFEAWQIGEQFSTATYEDYLTALNRMTRDAIQDHDLGETMPFMHETLGKVFSELKTFFLVSHAKNFLKNAHYRDATAFQVWAIGFVGESLAYMTQQSINNAHDPDKLLANLNPEKIATAAMFRSPALGALPMLMDTGFGVLTGGDSLVQPGMTANTDNRSFLNTPSLVVAKRLLNAPMTAAGLVLGTDVTTRAEGRDLAGALPGSNLYGIKGLASYLANSLPATDPSHGW